MPDYPRISELPGFIPASEAPARVLDIFTNAAANEAFVRELARLATTHNDTPVSAPPLADVAVTHA